MASSDLAISVRGISKAYKITHNLERPSTLAEAALQRLRSPFGRTTRDTFWALQDVSFDVAKGEVIGIIGRNGAGKSTLLKVMSRITEPTSGEIDLYGRIGSLLEVGTGFHPELTGRENIYLNGQILGMRRKEIDRHFDAIVDFSGVEQFIDTPVKRYSSGMYVRLAFAVAAHLEPEILVVDEVLAVGDVGFQKKCLGKLREVGQQGRTVLLVSHNIAAIQYLCTSGLFLRAGKVRAFGKIQTVISEYLGETLEVTDGIFDLFNHTARVSQLKPWLVSLALSNGDGTATSRFRSSDKFSAILRIRPPRRVRNPQLALAIEDQYGRRITTSATNFVLAETGTFEGEFEARCEFRLGLGPGRYMVSISISEFGTGLLDSIDGAGWFEVEWDNIYPTGAFHGEVYGPVVTGGAWEVGQ